jgi:hypothetical protein
MKFLITSTISFFLCITMSAFGVEALIVGESFETDGSGSRYTVVGGFDDGSSDYFTRLRDTDAVARSAGILFGGEDGSWFFSGEDLDAVDTGALGYGTVTISGIDVSGKTDLRVSIRLAAARIANYGPEDILRIQYAINGSGTFTTIGAFYGVSPWDNPMQRDADLNGVADASGAVLNNTFQTFSFNIPATGNSLAVRIYLSVDGGSEETSFDLIQVYGDQAITESAFTVAGNPVQHGSPSPNGYGSVNIVDGTLVTNSVNSPADQSAGTRYVCTGWTGTGSVPNTGSSSSCSFTINANSSLTWQWSPSYYLDTGVSGSGAVSLTDAWHMGTSTVVQATADPNWHFTSWSGDTNGCDLADNVITATMDQARSITANFAIDQYTVIFTAGSDGSLTGTATQQVNHASDCVAVTAVANPNHHFVNWSGDYSGSENPLTVSNVTAAMTLTATFGIDEHALEVVSDHSTATPAVGTYTNDYGTTLANSVTTPFVQGATQYVNTGWSMTGNAPLTGSTDTCLLTLTNDATLTWLWTTNFWLDLSISGDGSVDQSDQWASSDSVVVIHPTPDHWSAFTQWLGDVPASNATANPLSLTMDQAKGVTAQFAQIACSNGTAVAWLQAHGLTNYASPSVAEDTDSDGDGLMAWEEYIAGTDPTNAHSCFAVRDIQYHGSSNAVVWFGTTNSGVRTPFCMERSTNLLDAGDWLPLDTEIDRDSTGTNIWWDESPPAVGAAYYRVVATNAP